MTSDEHVKTNVDSKRLAQLLKNERLKKGFTLREVEKVTNGDVSNAYLSQLENGKIAKPSPHILFSLSTALDVKYDALMERAGYISASKSKSKDEKHGRAATFSIDNLSNEEETQLRKYLNFIRVESNK